MRNRTIVLSMLGVTTMLSTAWALTPSAPGAKVYFVEPENNATVSSPVTIKFGIQGMDVVPAGTDKPNSGHHHLLVDGATLPAMDAPVPKDDTHIHFGKGQTEATLPLPPGKHTLQMVFADKDHIPHQQPLMSDTISITVK